MANLPAAFSEYTRQLMGEERFERYLKSFEEEPPVSIRLNPMKIEEDRWKVADAEPVPWCRNAFYLKQRPNFTMDPLFHAGCYYVQEAASMFLDTIFTQRNRPYCVKNVLDMCAAPGGKSTLLRAALPDDCVLYSNEPIHNRANILLENVTKWGYPNHVVTNAYPKDYRASKMKFDVILCDVPCSGEGMFRKDETTIREWSPQNVEKCWRLQRDIVSDAWPCLNAGGLFIYSTCTFNIKENEENIRWMLETFPDAEVLPIEVKPEWNITGSLLEGFNEPVYRFIPGISRGEGLFICVLRKGRQHTVEHLQQCCKPSTEVLYNIHNKVVKHPQQSCKVSTGKLCSIHNNTVKHLQEYCRIPQQAVQHELTYYQAISYLRGEALILPENTPRGEVAVTFQGHPLGMVKNIGTRANNLYPKAWRIKTTHIPTEYEAILRHT
jgi:16S rRNA C967 or C1407 C5-methylase (RsmB/RsmF family)